MKTDIYSIAGAKKGSVELPAVFATPVRPDLITRAVLHEDSLERQPKGAYKLAGMQTTAGMRGEKDTYRSIKNKGISRLPREKLPKGAFGKVRIVPFAVGGRRAHPPNPEEILVEFMNKKEHTLAINSALAATANAELVKKRGHKTTVASAPVVFEDAFEGMTKTADVATLLEKIGINDIARAEKGTRKLSGVRKTRRGAKRTPKSVLVVVSAGAKVAKAARNLAGVDVCVPAKLEARLLAPGCAIGRLAVFSEAALKEIAKR